ncbi:MAG: response regulator transcription factor [Egibacteraceae bacterium]
MRILIIEDHELLAQTLQVALRADGFEVDVVGDLSAEHIVSVADETRPRVVLLDLDLGPQGGSGLPLIRPLRDLGATVVVVTGETDRARLGECVQAGAHGLLAKSAPFDVLLDAVKGAAEARTLLTDAERDALLGDLRREHAAADQRQRPFTRLTAREREVLAALCAGQSADTIASESFVSMATVRSQIHSLLQKLGVHSQIGAVAAARRAGWTPDTD